MARENERYPEGEALIQQIGRRHRVGLIWRVLFLAATIVGIVALTALLYNIINQAFGLAAVENEKNPQTIALDYQVARMLQAPNTEFGENDDALVAQIADDPHAVGFFGYAYFQQYGDSVRALAVDGVTPSAETAASGEYPLTRPLFLYTTASLADQKPQVTAFVDFYLQHVGDVIEEVGYFPAGEEAMAEARSSWLAATGRDTLPAVDPAAFDGDISIAGSSTLYPLTLRIAEMFQERGFAGNVEVENVGTRAGLRGFCVDGDVDVVDASRTILPAEFEACRAGGRLPLQVTVGTDALSVVVSRQNDFATGVSLEEVRSLFTAAESWSDVNDAWPAQPIARYIPGGNSGTIDFFAETVFPTQLAELPKDALVSILAPTISEGVGRRLEREQRFFDNYLIFESRETWTTICAAAEPPPGCTGAPRSQQNVYGLVVERVVVPDVVQTWSLVDSIFRRGEVLTQIAREYPGAQPEFRSWITPSFVTNPQSDKPELSGVRTAVLGSLWVIAITILFSLPIGVGAAIYLEEYARENRINRIIQTNINNLAGVPSIIYGMLGLAIFVRAMQTLTSGVAFGAADPTTANGRTILSAGLTLGLLILPIIIINAQEAIRAVPTSLRQASYGLGATGWQTIWSHVLPSALPGILTGAILSMSRAIGETAPLVVVGASTFITFDPDGPFSKFTVLPIQIYQWTSRPQHEFRNIAAAAIIVLLVLLLTLNATAVLLRNRYSKRLT
ncbi:MAG: phosphate ABC transporter permease PstA [Candidatus Promineifilaceae bacterium]|nr:phosphate ABC transporter permease PstA [Candidatus Promineifilaceae bacterium]